MSFHQSAINKAKQVAHAANGGGNKKRKKGTDLKPIITTEQQKQEQDAHQQGPGFHYKYVCLLTACLGQKGRAHTPWTVE